MKKFLFIDTFSKNLFLLIDTSFNHSQPTKEASNKFNSYLDKEKKYWKSFDINSSPKLDGVNKQVILDLVKQLEGATSTMEGFRTEFTAEKGNTLSEVDKISKSKSNPDFAGRMKGNISNTFKEYQMKYFESRMLITGLMAKILFTEEGEYKAELDQEDAIKQFKEGFKIIIKDFKSYHTGDVLAHLNRIKSSILEELAKDDDSDQPETTPTETLESSKNILDDIITPTASSNPLSHSDSSGNLSSDDSSDTSGNLSSDDSSDASGVLLLGGVVVIGGLLLAFA